MLWIYLDLGSLECSRNFSTLFKKFYLESY
jgi:hypothetical protein